MKNSKSWFVYGTIEMKRQSENTNPGFYSEEEVKLLLAERLQRIAEGNAVTVQHKEVNSYVKALLPYTHEQMEASLLEAEDDYQNGRFVSHSSICERFGI